MKNYEKYISKSAIEKIHEKSLYILENIGVQVEHDKACALLKQHGAQVEGHLVRLSAEMVDAALALAKPTFDLYSSTSYRWRRQFAGRPSLQQHLYQ